MTNARRASQGQELATKLKDVMDRAFTGNLRQISNKPEGIRPGGNASGPAARRQLCPSAMSTLTSISSGSRIPAACKIWLISAETLAKVPDLYDSLQVHQVETHLPSFVVQYEFLGMPIWQWLALVLAIPAAAAAGKLAVWLLGLFRKLRRHQPEHATAWAAISPPLWLVISTIIHIAFERFLGCLCCYATTTRRRSALSSSSAGAGWSGESSAR